MFYYRMSSVWASGLFLILYFYSISPISGNCVHQLTSSRGVISSPNYPNKYPGGKMCTWHFNTTPGRRISLLFEDFQLESCRNCTCDYVSFYDGDNSQSPVLGKFCGSEVPHPITSTGNKMLMTFRTDARTEMTGFKSIYTAAMPWEFTLMEAKQRALQWFLEQRNESREKRGYEVARIAVALYTIDPEFFSAKNETGREIGYELTIQLLSDLIGDKTQKLSASDLSVYLNGLIVSCINPKNFHGMNLVTMIRERFEENVNTSSPYVLLSLCNAGDKMTQRDVDRLTDYEEHPSRPSWTGHKALVLMALTCIKNKKEENVIVHPDLLRELAVELAEKQFRNGSIENLPTTGLVVQALNASNLVLDEWIMDDAINYLLSSQSTDGSFGNIPNTYYILPVLSNKTLIDNSASHCRLEKKRDEVSAVKYLHNKFGSKIYVWYTLWIGDEVDVARTLQLRVVANSSLFDVMYLAAEVDPMYRFEYTMLNRKPYVYLISKIQDNPENNKFWFLYKYNKEKTELIPLASSPASIIPKNKEEYVLWYRTKNYGAVFPKLKNLLS